MVKHYRADEQVQVRKMEQQLHQKEDMGEVLHVVDFDQLKIENQQYLDKIEERNSELLRLKTTTGKAVQVQPAPLVRMNCAHYHKTYSISASPAIVYAYALYCCMSVPKHTMLTSGQSVSSCELVPTKRLHDTYTFAGHQCQHAAML